MNLCITGKYTYTAYRLINTGLPKYCVHRRDAVELRVGGIRVLNTVITDRGTVNHYHHCSTHWRVRGSELHRGTGDICGLDTGSAVRIEQIRK